MIVWALAQIFKFWNWYANFANEGRGALRFVLFMALATMCLMIIPVTLHYTNGWRVELAQLLGLAIMIPLVLTKMMRPKTAQNS